MTLAVEDIHHGYHYRYTSTNVRILEPHTNQIFRFDCIYSRITTAPSSSRVVEYTPAQRKLVDQVTVRNVEMRCQSIFYFATMSEIEPGLGVCKYYSPQTIRAARRAGPKIQPVSEEAFQTARSDPIARDHRPGPDEMDRAWFDTDEAHRQRVLHPDTGSLFIEVLDLIVEP